jgi:uncharacterized protein (TIGR03067 family)
MLTASALVLLLCGASLLRGADTKDDKTWDKQLEGTWEQVSLLRDGAKDEPPSKPEITFTKNHLAVKVGDRVEKFALKVDATQKPKTIDLIMDEGPEKGKKALGIYELKGDELRLCFNKPGEKDRATKFASEKGSGAMLVMLKRIKP